MPEFLNLGFECISLVLAVVPLELHAINPSLQIFDVNAKLIPLPFRLDLGLLQLLDLGRHILCVRPLSLQLVPERLVLAITSLQPLFSLLKILFASRHLGQ